MQNTTQAEEKHQLHRYLTLSYWLTILLFILPEILFFSSYAYSRLHPEFDFWDMIPVENAYMLFALLVVIKPIALLGLQHLCVVTRDRPVSRGAWKISKGFFWVMMGLNVAALCFLFYIANYWAE